MYKKLVFITFLLVIFDQITKVLISFNMHLNQSINIIPNFFSLKYVINYGAAFSLFNGYRFIFIILALIFLYVIYIWFINNKDLNKLNVISYSLLISGIIGNLIDRVVYGYVIDFLSFNILGYPFAIFNLADSFIVISIILILIGDKNGRNNSRKRRN